MAKKKRKNADKSKSNGDLVTDNIAAVAFNKRRFEFTEGSSNKFWEIKLSDNSVITTWGRIGTNGQSKTKKYANATKAKQAFAILIENKTDKGYTETT